MDRDREANTRCTWFIQIGYVHRVEEFSLIVKGLHKYIGLSSPLVDVASSLKVLFLHPGMVSLTGGDAQGVPQVAELGDLPKEVTDKSIRRTQEFEGQNKSIKSRVRSTLMIWNTFAVNKVVDVSARVLLRLSPHASLYPSHLPYMFLRQMWYLLRKHKMLKMSTREQCQTSFIQGNLALKVLRAMPLRFSNKQSCRGSGSRDLENGASLILEKAILLGVWLLRFGERCLFNFLESNPVGSLVLEIQRAVPFRFLSNNLVRSVFSNMSKGWAFFPVSLAMEHGG
ncbi:hypothetical protein ACFX12_034997 [Malus domestica]